MTLLLRILKGNLVRERDRSYFKIAVKMSKGVDICDPSSCSEDGGGENCIEYHKNTNLGLPNFLEMCA